MHAPDPTRLTLCCKLDPAAAPPAVVSRNEGVSSNSIPFCHVGEGTPPTRKPNSN
jgi:hypothetical protein